MLVCSRVTRDARGEALYLWPTFNRVDFTGLAAGVNDPNFGNLTATKEASEIQCSFRLAYDPSRIRDGSILLWLFVSCGMVNGNKQGKSVLRKT